MAGDGAGIPVGIVAAGANEHASPLLEPTLAAIPDLIGPLPKPPYQPRVHLDHGYDSATTCDLLEILGYDAEIAAKAVPAPIQAGKRWPIERTHSWMNGSGKLRPVTDKRNSVVHFYLRLAAAITVLRRLINHARTLHRWDCPEPGVSGSTGQPVGWRGRVADDRDTAGHDGIDGGGSRAAG